MLYHSSLTIKGQMTIPKELRELLGLSVPSQVFITFDKKTQNILIKKTSSLLSLSGTVKTKKKINMAKLRDMVESTYERN